jgi:hypothetical protein
MLVQRSRCWPKFRAWARKMPRVIVYGSASIGLYAIVDVPDGVPDVADAARTAAAALCIPTPSHAPYLVDEGGWRINDAHLDDVTITELVPI